MDGVINLLKEPGPTSHDMVYKIRKLLMERKVGHAGTLDPGASGVLVVGVGRATRVLEYLLEEPKTYAFEIIFGFSTTTLDTFGEICEEGQGQITKEDLEKILVQFLGPQKQIPPMASAIKVGGKKLYELMREGREIERAPRDVTIYSLEMNHAPDVIKKGSRVFLRAQVSKGTYIRSLCQDIGEKAGLKAHMGFLLRTKSGGLKIEDALFLDEIEQKMQKGLPFLIPFDQVLNFTEVIALPRRQKALLNGQSLFASDVEGGFNSLKPDQKVKVYTGEKLFVGIYRYIDKEQPILQPEKIFIS